jgi:hypothetical protein
MAAYFQDSPRISSLCCERAHCGVGDCTKTDEAPVAVALCRILRVLMVLIVYLLCLTSAVDEGSKMNWRQSDVAALSSG